MEHNIKNFMVKLKKNINRKIKLYTKNSVQVINTVSRT